MILPRFSPSYHGVNFPAACLAPTRDVCLIPPASLRESPALDSKLVSGPAGESLTKQVVGILAQFQPDVYAGPGVKRVGMKMAHQALSSVTMSEKANAPFRFMGHSQRLHPGSLAHHSYTLPRLHKKGHPHIHFTLQDRIASATGVGFENLRSLPDCGSEHPRRSRSRLASGRPPCFPHPAFGLSR